MFKNALMFTVGHALGGLCVLAYFAMTVNKHESEKEEDQNA